MSHPTSQIADVAVQIGSFRFHFAEQSESAVFFWRAFSHLRRMPLRSKEVKIHTKYRCKDVGIESKTDSHDIFPNGRTLNWIVHVEDVCTWPIMRPNFAWFTSIDWFFRKMLLTPFRPFLLGKQCLSDLMAWKKRNGCINQVVHQEKVYLTGLLRVSVWKSRAFVSPYADEWATSNVVFYSLSLKLI